MAKYRKLHYSDVKSFRQSNKSKNILMEVSRAVTNWTLTHYLEYSLQWFNLWFLFCIWGEKNYMASKEQLQVVFV